jgi:hypothetical protein
MGADADFERRSSMVAASLERRDPSPRADLERPTSGSGKRLNSLQWPVYWTQQYPIDEEDQDEVDEAGVQDA